MCVNYCDIAKNLYEALGNCLLMSECHEQHTPENEGLLLPFGDHVINVRLEKPAKEVYVSVHDEGGPVCGGEISTVGVTLLDDGFVLYVHCKSDSCLVKWIVRHEK
jgi:hypothetical protein